MDFLPQELVQAIVQEIDDIPSLKSCALTGSIFRDASQRILLRSLTLQGDLQPAYTLLTESPHVATYINRLSITLERVDGDGHSLQQTLQQILAKLLSVRECILMRHIPTFLPDFLARQPLRELTVVHSDGVSPASILRLLTTARVVRFINVVVENDPHLSDNPQYTPRVEELVIFKVTPNFYELVAHPRIKSLAGMLRRLSILEAHDAWRATHGLKLISIAAPTLEYLYLAGLTHLVILPELPSLSTIAFKVQFDDWSPWLLDIISSVLRTSPLLANIAVYFIPIYVTECPPISEGALTMLDVVLAAHPRHLVLRWQLDFVADDESADARVFTEFTTSIQTGMPKMHEQGRLNFVLTG